MCVTNTTHRRAQAVSIHPAQIAACPSIISQRLLGAYPTAVHSMHSQQKIISFPYELTQPPTEKYVAAAPPQKPRPKRRRKPQKPGKTAKMNDRHFVVHNYHDHASDPGESVELEPEDPHQRRRGGVVIAFPSKLHAVLDQVEADGLAHIVSWQQHGRCFVIHRPKEFVDHVMPRYFRQTKLTSFQRQLNLYGFCRLTRGPDAGGYYHELFLRGKTFLCKKMVRTKVKGTRFKAASSPDEEPDFYKMPPITVTPPSTSDEDQSFSSERSHETMTHCAPVSAPPPATMEPIPIEYTSVPAPAPISFMPPPSALQRSQPQPYAEAPQPASDEASRFLDEAVDELFMHDAADSESLSDFVHDWDPAFGAEPVQDDSQLGLILEKLLED